MSERLRDRLIGVGLVMGVLAGLFSFGGLCWALSETSLVEARLWALLATAALPIAGLLGWLLGKGQARDHLRGLDQGIDRVMKAAGATAALRVSAARAYKVPPTTPTPDPHQVVIIPAPTPSLGNGNGDDVLLLE